MEKKFWRLEEFAKDQKGWPTRSVLRTQFHNWKTKVPGFRGKHFFKMGRNVMVDKEEYFKWIASFQEKNI